jgi:hypothetical protein
MTKVNVIKRQIIFVILIKNSCPFIFCIFRIQEDDIRVKFLYL